MDRNILLLLSFIYSCSFIASIASEFNTCTAAQQCVDLKDCPAINNLVQKRPVPQDAVDLLRKAHCGFTGKLPKVCCERTASPKINSEFIASQFHACTASQQCLSLTDCPAINNLLQTRPVPQYVKDMLREIHCGFSEKIPKVCCEKTGSNLQVGETKIGSSLDELLSAASTTSTTEPSSVNAGGTDNNLLPNKKICGIQIVDRIIGGTETDIGTYPWMALLEYQRPTKRSFNCGGSLINHQYILTAAHCLKRIPDTWKLINVRLGEHDLSKPVDCDTENPVPGVDVCNDPQDIGIEEQIVHKKYDPDDKNQPYDIALLRLNRPVEYTDFIAPICLPLSEDLKRQDYIGRHLTVAGWGKTENRSQSAVKLSVDVPVRSNKDCEPIYKQAGVTLVSSQLCAGGVKAKDSCSGDSGGPLMIKVETNYYEHGIVSFGPTRCGFENFPGIYTRVADYIDWIQQNMRP